MRSRMLISFVLGTAAGGAASWAQSPGEGNPFPRFGRPRATLVSPPATAPHIDDHVRPATYDAVLPTSPPMPTPPPTEPAIMTPPATIAPPTSTVLPNIVTPPPPEPAAAQPPLAGTALLKQRPAAGAEHPLTPVARWCEDALRQMHGLRDYTCTF